MHFEAAFFGEQPATPRPPRVALLAADFDETCTAADTTGAIIGAAIDAAVRRSEGEPGQMMDVFIIPRPLISKVWLVASAVLRQTQR